MSVIWLNNNLEFNNPVKRFTAVWHTREFNEIGYSDST